MDLKIIFSIISSYLFCSCTGEDGQSFDKLIHKICTVARDKLNIEGATPEKRHKILQSMREKLKKTSNELGIESTARNRLIIQGITILATDENYQKLCTGFNNKNISAAQRRNIFIEMTKTGDKLEQSNINANNDYIQDIVIKTTTTTCTPTGGDSKKMAEISSLIGKMETIMKTSVKDDSTIAEKVEVAKKLKQQFIEAFRRAYHNSDKLTTYISLVEQSMNLAVEKLISDSLRRSNLSNAALIGQEALADVTQPKLLKEDLVNYPRSQQITEPEKVPRPISNLSSTTQVSMTSTTNLPGVTKQFGCNDILKDTCINLKSLDKFTCENDGSTLDMQQVCNGHIDCPDSSDEKNCIQQVIAKIHNATQVMAKVEMSQNCFKSIIDKSLLSKQGELLASLLKTQVDFLNKYTQKKLHFSSSNPGDKDAQKKHFYSQSISELAFEVAVIVRSFASTLMNALCDMEDKVQKDINDMLGATVDQEFEELQFQSRTSWLPSLCHCQNGHCVNATSCNARCKRYCYQIHSLQNFNCKSIKKGLSTVSLDVVCDGKLDCVDETDEANCAEESSMSKFEGSKLLDKTLNFVKLKAMTKDFASARVEMVELQACIQGLQRRMLEVQQIKQSRDKCFAKLVDIFETMLEEGALTQGQQELIYDILLIVNENMAVALKHTHFGNKNIISSKDCFCRGSECGQVKCPPRCIRLCAVKMLFTNYNCSNSPINATVPIESICNDKNNCPNGEDELNCKKDVCRTHHLKVIRHNIKTLCENYNGTSIGDVLDKWRTKVVSNLVVLEKSGGRLTPKLFRHTVSEMLNDLSLSYGAMTPTRRQENDRTRLKKFAKLSQYIMEMLKECNT